MLKSHNKYVLFLYNCYEVIIIRIHYISFGCKVNLYETECVKELLVSEGYEISESEKDANIFLINTCTVTSERDKKLRKTINRIKKSYPGAVIGLMGCFVQAFPDKAKELNAEILIGNGNKTEILSALRQYHECKAKQLYINDNSVDSRFEPMCLGGFQKKTRAFLKIQDGCNQFCTYCIIPKARGRICSKPVDEIKKEVEILDSEYDDWSIENANLNKQIIGKEHLMFIIEDEVGEIFGYYLHSKIQAKYNGWISTNKKTFHFNLQSQDNRLSKPMKFSIVDCDEGYWLVDEFSDKLIALGNIWLMKDHIGKLSRCDQYNFNYPEIDNVLCGKEQFTPKKIVVIQMN